MTLFSGIAGFGARYSQVSDKIREDMSELMGIKLRDNITRGQARWDAHKEEKKLKRTIAKTLKGYGLTVDQIGVALEQGRGEEVVNYFRKFDGLDETLKTNLGYKGTNIITMGEGYEASGMTMDEMLNTVTGKVSGGMTMTAALADTTGTSKQGVFGKFLSPDTNKIAQRQLRAYEAVYGKGTLNKMGQYASGTIKASDLPFEGTINLKTQLDNLALKKEMRDAGDTGIPKNFTSATNYLTKQAAPLIEGAEIGLGGNLTFASKDARKANKAGILNAVNNYIATSLTAFNVPGGGTISQKQIEEVRLGLGKFVSDYAPPPPKSGGNGGQTTADKMKSMEIGARTGTGEFGNEPRLTWVQKYKKLILDIGLATTDADAADRANEIYNQLLLTRRENEANKPQNERNPRGTGSN